MWKQAYRVVVILVASGFFHHSHACTVEDVDQSVPVTREIKDTFRGIFFSSNTQNIQEPVSLIQNEGLKEGPYLDIFLNNSLLTIGTNDNFANYEEVETETTMRYTVNLGCTSGSRLSFVLIINIRDTNNNNPIFLQPEYEFNIVLPVPPGFMVTNCENDIVVRDIDLTTRRIDFKLNGSDLFEISYDPSSKVPKEFKSILRTTTLIRYIPEQITLTLTATDVDETSDPARSNTTTVIIKADNQFQFPDEPIFSQPFYLASYERESDFVLQDTIYLEQGYDDQVKFSFESDFSEYFNMIVDGNKVQFNMNKSIPVQLYEKKQIYLVVKAEREYTSGATAAVILKLPIDTKLEFERAIYKGKITDNVLNLTDLILKQGYEHSNITVEISSEYSFKATVLSNIIKLSMDPLTEDVIRNNNFIGLEVLASNNRTKARTIVVLEIIKEDTITPVFEKYIYNGNYSNETGFVMDDIILIQGFDETVNLTLEGEYFTFFEISQDGARIRLKPLATPEELMKTNIILSILAVKPRTVGAHATINIAVPSARSLVFEKDLYIGTIEKNNLTLNNIVLTEGYASDINFTLTGDLSNHFSVSNNQNILTVSVTTELPETVVLENDFIVLTLVAFGMKAITTSTNIVIRIIKEDYLTPIFNERIYSVKYENDQLNAVNMTLIQGFDETVTFELIGVHREFFSLETSLNTIKLVVNSTIPEDIIFNEKVIILNVVARKPLTVGANAAVYITFPPEMTELGVLNFTQNAYSGSLKEGVLIVEDIILEYGYTPQTTFILSGDHSDKFSLNYSSNVITVILNSNVSLEEIERQNFITLEVKATRRRTIPATTVVVVYINRTSIGSPIFEQAFYSGSYTNDGGLVFEQVISLQEGFDSTVEFNLEKEYSQWFVLEQNGNSVILKLNTSNPIPEAITEKNKQFLITIFARKPETVDGRAVIYIDLPKENSNIRILQFEHVSYLGSIESGVIQLEEIRLRTEITSAMDFNITGEYASYFTISKQTESIQIDIMDAPPEVFENNDFLVLNINVFEVGSVSGHTTAVLNIIKDRQYKNITPVFSEAYYTGQYSKDTGLLFSSIITLIQGYDETVTFLLDSEDSKGFELVETDVNNFTLTFNGSSSEGHKKNYLLFPVIALKPNSRQGSAAIFISMTGSPETNVFFDKILYNGKLEDDILSHDTITLTGFNGTNILITGENSRLFEAEFINGFVKVTTTSSSEFPRELTHIALELQAGSAKSVLLIDVSFSDNPDLPKIAFKSESYFFWADVKQTGEIGKVEATVDNDEAVTYSLRVTNDHIASRLNIDESNGVLQLTNVAEKGIYNFNVKATSVQSKVEATASVLLRVDALPDCGGEVGLSPLIVIERVEEEAHYNLVVLNETEHEGCKYTLTNVFPEDQSWLYVENNGLHTKPIDREDKSIAFMTLSQIQVELTLKCDSDGVPAFAKRSLDADDSSYLYSYDYGPNKWVLTDTILYNARRSFVNLIVKDINDNSPKFNGKENDTIYVGYPVSEIEGLVLPRALAELKATDEDIGENAAIMYWSGEDNLAVSPNTGLVHVRNNAKLENNSRLTVYAIDQNGQGNNGSIDIVVKLLNKNQIAVLTIRNAFLEDESNVLNDLSNSVGYDIKVLRSIVISDSYDESNRTKRGINSNSGSSLQLYVYGLKESEPVDINQLTGDINNNNVATITIARILSLEDHLDSLAICPGLERDIGLLATTIALSILILILIIAISVLFFLKWRITRNYERFSDSNSTTSQLASPKLPVIEVPQKTRLNMEEIKRSEKRLQEMLEEPVESQLDSETDDIKEVNETLDEAIVNISSDVQLPIIIQSIDKLKDGNDESDDNDEYGEMKQPRKSVVTFNENVEKIIHIEDVNEDESSEQSFEVYKF
ncbi:uncharacterized protein LOC116765839 isoform X2 [Danaus plexippus]|uniref:uncharacterized protein LOC116765839 isoform X2 n=1 Tax=Danaus plexippus TaxID=13037 RepID=UPI002AB2F714|nr:uncharacterized protein LOC116765839 isoform X2 [Danaus plexippus]